MSACCVEPATCLDVLLRVGSRLVPVTMTFASAADAWEWYLQQYDNPRAVKTVSKAAVLAEMTA